MRPLTTLFLSVAAAFCASATRIQAVAPQDPLQVVTTIPDLEDLISVIGGDRVEVVQLVPAGADPHSVLPKASMLLKLAKSDLLVMMGLDYEHAFLPALLEKSRNQAIREGGAGHLDLGGLITPLEVPTSFNRSQGADLHPRGNPHYNLDPYNGRLMAAAIRDTLVRLDPDGADGYRARWQAWDQEAQRRIRLWAQLMAPLKGEKMVIYHRSWSYFVQRYGLEVVAEIEPKPGLAPSAQHLLEVKKTILEEHVRVVAMEPWYNERSIRSLIGDEVTVAKLSTTSGSGARDAHYLDHIDHIVRTLRVAYGLPAEDPEIEREASPTSLAEPQ